MCVGLLEGRITGIGDRHGSRKRKKVWASVENRQAIAVGFPGLSHVDLDLGLCGIVRKRDAS